MSAVSATTGRSGRGGTSLALAFVLMATLAIAGCVSLPTTGHPKTDDAQNSGQGSAVQIWAQSPQPGEKPQQIVDDFLQAAAAASTTGDSAETRIAQKYLTSNGLKSWDSGKVSVFSDLYGVTPADDTNGSDGWYEFTGTLIGTVSDTGQYTVTSATKSTYRFQVVAVDKGTNRISTIESEQGNFGAALTQEEFAASYSNYNLNFLNSANPAAAMIPAPVYLRASASDHDQAYELAQELFEGPGALGSIAQNAVKAPSLKSLVIQPGGVAVVTIGDPQDCAANAQVCGSLAQQLMNTFNGISSITSVQVQGPNGTQLGATATASSGPATTLAPSNPSSPIGYYLGSDSARQHQVFSLDGRPTDPGSPAVTGPPTAQYGQLAVVQTGNGSKVAALTNVNNTKLMLGVPGNPASPPLRYTGTAISSMSWDLFGGLWFIDTSAGGNAQVYRLDQTEPTSTAQQVDITGIAPGDTIKSVAVAPDGQRLAVVVENPAGPYDDLIIGTVQQTTVGWSVDVATGGSQYAAKEWSNIAQVAWRDSEVLGVLGSPQASVTSTVPGTIYELRTDGSPVIDPVTQQLVNVTPLKYVTSFAWASGGTLLADTQVPASTQPSGSSDNLLTFPSGASGWSPRAIGTLGTVPATTP